MTQPITPMVERVARALLKRMLPNSTDIFVDERWPEYAHLAQAAIEAMREASETMQRDGAMEFAMCRQRFQTAEHCAGDIFHAMISAALGEKPA